MVIRVPALIQPVDPRVSSQRPTGCWSASIWAIPAETTILPSKNETGP